MSGAASSVWRGNWDYVLDRLGVVRYTNGRYIPEQGVFENIQTSAPTVPTQSVQYEVAVCTDLLHFLVSYTLNVRVVAMKAYRRSGCTAPHILNLSIRWK